MASAVAVVMPPAGPGARGGSKRNCTMVLRSPSRWRSSLPLRSRLPAGPITRARRTRPVLEAASTSIRLAPAVSWKARRS